MSGDHFAIQMSAYIQQIERARFWEGFLAGVGITLTLCAAILFTYAGL